MRKKNQNVFSIFIGIVFALLIGLGTISSFYYGESILPAVEYSVNQNNDLQQTAIEFDNQHPFATFFCSRKPIRQSNFRPQQNSRVQVFHSKNGTSKSFIEFKPLKTLVYLNKITSVYPASHIYSTSKEYFVYTLKRILC